MTSSRTFILKLYNCIDLNGDKRPNKVGIDIFYFLFTTDGHIIPEGTDHPDNNYTANYYAGGTVKAASNYCNGWNEKMFWLVLIMQFTTSAPKATGHIGKILLAKNSISNK